MSDRSATEASAGFCQRITFALVLSSGGMALAYFLAAVAVIELARTPHGFAGIWIANALALTILLRQEQHRWWPLLGAVLVGGVLANLVTGTGLWMGLALMAANVTEIAIAAFAIRRFQIPTVQFDNDYFAYLRLQFVAAIAAPAVAATMAAAVLLTKGVPHTRHGWPGGPQTPRALLPSCRSRCRFRGPR